MSTCEGKTFPIRILDLEGPCLSRGYNNKQETKMLQTTGLLPFISVTADCLKVIAKIKIRSSPN